MSVPRSGRRHLHWARQWARRALSRLRVARTVLVAIVLGLGLSALAALPLAGLNGAGAALACGLGPLPTMLANGAPALIYPVPVGANPPTAGVFPLQFVAGQTITFSEDLSKVQPPQNASNFQWRWNFGDGSATSNAIAPTHTFAKSGTYNVLSQIQDPSGWQDFDSAQIQVIATAIPNPPVARATANITAIVQGQDTVTFDATGSHAVVGSHLSYLWNFGDAETATGPRATHQFAILGSGFVALTVTDDRGARAVATVNIGVVSNQQQIPTANLTSSSDSVQAGQSVTFDASGSQPAAAPANDQIVRYAWNFGDGSPGDSTTQPTAAHMFKHEGDYTVTVQAFDTAGIPAQATLNVAVFAASGLGGSGAPGWLLVAAIAVVLALAAGGGWFAVRAQHAQAAARAREEQLAARRARRIPAGGVRPGDPRWGDPRGGARTGGQGHQSGYGPRTGGQRPPSGRSGDGRDSGGGAPRSGQR